MKGYDLSPMESRSGERRLKIAFHQTGEFKTRIIAAGRRAAVVVVSLQGIHLICRESLDYSDFPD